jgi:hypothetical protein
MWNSYVGLLTSTPVPNSIPVQIDILTANTNVQYFQRVVDAVYSVPYGGLHEVITIDLLVELLKDEMVEKLAGSIKWVPRVAVYIDSSLTVNKINILLAQISANLVLDARRQPEIYKDQYQALRYPTDGETYSGFVNGLDI